jgi:hypothetical protein
MGFRKKTEAGLFDKGMLQNLKEKKSKQDIMSKSQISFKGLKNPEIVNTQGLRVLTRLTVGMKRLLKNKAEGRLISKWVEDDVYKNLLKMVGRYVFLLGKPRILLQFIFFSISTILFIGIDFWTGAWSNKIYDLDRNNYMAIYLLISIGATTVVFFRDILFYRIIMKNSRKLH